MRTLTRMTLRTRNGPIPPVKVAALANVRHGLGHVDSVETTEEGEGVDSDVEEPRVDLAKGVAGEDARGLLEGGDDWVGVG